MAHVWLTKILFPLYFNTWVCPAKGVGSVKGRPGSNPGFSARYPREQTKAKLAGFFVGKSFVAL